MMKCLLFSTFLFLILQATYCIEKSNEVCDFIC